MITVNFYRDGKLTLGVKTPKGIFDVERAASSIRREADVPLKVQDLILQGEEGQGKLGKLVDRYYAVEQLFYSEESLEYGPCITEPQKIICIGLNYKKHAEECRLPYPKTPIIFSKFNNTLAGHKQVIPMPQESSQVDYEGELAIVIGREAKSVEVQDAISYIYGYCNANDLSARDLQTVSPQWLLGKSCDKFCPIGPYLVTRSEIENPNRLRIRSLVNGEVRQDSNTSDMIFSCEEIVSYISRHMTLYPGDIILTGTPEGVIMGYPKERQIWLKEGDTISIEVENLGRLTHSLG